MSQRLLGLFHLISWGGRMKNLGQRSRPRARSKMFIRTFHWIMRAFSMDLPKRLRNTIGRNVGRSDAQLLFRNWNRFRNQNRFWNQPYFCWNWNQRFQKVPGIGTGIGIKPHPESCITGWVLLKMYAVPSLEMLPASQWALVVLVMPVYQQTVKNPNFSYSLVPDPGCVWVPKLPRFGPIFG